MKGFSVFAQTYFILSRPRSGRVDGRTVSQPMSQAPALAGPPKLRAFGAVYWIGFWTLYV